MVLAVSFILLSLVGFSGHILGIRYQFGFFVLGIPLVGVVFSRWKRLWPILVIYLLLYSIPYILISNMRPVIGHVRLFLVGDGYYYHGYWILLSSSYLSRSDEPAKDRGASRISPGS